MAAWFGFGSTPKVRPRLNNSFAKQGGKLPFPATYTCCPIPPIEPTRNLLPYHPPPSVSPSALGMPGRPTPNTCALRRTGAVLDVPPRDSLLLATPTYRLA